uniref:Aminotransferase-like plant mobile domain-containing protein n=1 Tax=Setaria italica TaxID=4555 RepID=K4AGI9_SETIT
MKLWGKLWFAVALQKGGSSVRPVFGQCDYSRQVWLQVGQATDNQFPSLNSASTLIDWWLSIRRAMINAKARGLDSTIMLVCWRLWKERNGRAFATDIARTPQQLLPLIADEASLWVQSGARNLEAFGWKPPDR